MGERLGRPRENPLLDLPRHHEKSTGGFTQVCVRWDGQVSRSDLQGLNRTQVQIQGRGPGPARKKDAEGPSTPLHLAFEAARPSPIPSRYGWQRGRWGGRSPATGRFGTPLVETLLGGHHCPWALSQQRKSRGSTGRPAGRTRASRGCWRGCLLWPLDPDDTGWCQSLVQENPDPASL